MNNENKLKKEDVKDALTKLCKPNGDKNRPEKEMKTVDSIIPDIWKTLMLEGEPDTKTFEMLIIGVIEDLFGGWRQEIGNDELQKNDNDELRKKARKRDISLLSFGLLDGYPHTRNGVNTWLSDRYEGYLDNSDFIELEYPGEGTYQQIKKSDSLKNKRERRRKAQPRPLNNLTKISGDSRDDVADKLIDIIKKGTYKQYIKTSVSELALPCYTKKNFSPVMKPGKVIVVPGDDITDGSDTDRDLGGGIKIKPIEPHPEPLHPEPDDPSVQKKLSKTAVGLKVAIFVFVGLVLASAIIGGGSIVIEQRAVSLALEDSKKIEPTKIEIIKKNIQLSLGEDCYLSVKTEPSEVDPDALFYTSSNKDVAYVEHVHSNHVIATKKLKQGIKPYSDIVVHTSDDTAQDTVTVMIKGTIQD